MTQRSKQRVVIEQISAVGVDVPAVPLNADVDVAALTSMDRAAGDEPMFATVPLAQVGQVTRNQRRYDAVAVTALHDAIVAGQLSGGLGHPDPETMMHAYQAAALKWVGAVLVGDVLWGKAYLTRSRAGMELREEWRVALATGGQIGTSVYALAELVFDAEADVFDVLDPEFLRIDAVNPHETGATIATAKPHLTSEAHHEEMDAELVQRLRDALGLEPDADVLAAVTALLTAYADVQRQHVALLDAHIAALVLAQVPLPHVQAMVVRRVHAAEPQTLGDVEVALQAALMDPDVVLALDDGVQQEMGPALVPGTQGRQRITGLADNPWVLR